MSFARYALLAATLATGACSTAAQRQAATMDNGLVAARQQRDACYSQAMGDPIVGRVLNYIVTGSDDPQKLVKMSDQRFTDDHARQDLIEAHKRVLPCRNIEKAQFGAVDPAYGQVLALTHDAQDSVLLALLNNQINVGQANQRLLEIDRASDGAWEEASASITQRLGNAHTAEMQQRQSAALAMQQFSYQQQQLANQQRLLNGLNRPTTTRCQAYGNTINCNSF